MAKLRTRREWALYRAQLNCKVGKDALEGKMPYGLLDEPPLNYGVYCMMSALEDLAEAMAEDGRRVDPLENRKLG